MSVGPSGAALIRDRMTLMETRSIEAPNLPAGQLQSYFEAAMEKFEEKRRKMDHRSAVRSTVYATIAEANFSCMEIESVRESQHGIY